MISFKAMPGNARTLEMIFKLDKRFAQASRVGLQMSGIQIAGKKGYANDGLIKQDMNKPKSGRIYVVGKGRKGKLLKRLKLHQASAPGQSPSPITGELRDSVYFRVEGNDRLRIGADTPYARILELGGTTGRNHSSRIARRNYLRRPILESRRDIVNNMKSAIEANIKI